MPLQKFPFALPQNSHSLQNQILAGSCLLPTRDYTDPLVLPETTEPLLGKPEGLQVLFSGSLLRTLAGVRASRAFLCLCFFSDLLHGAKSKHDTVRSGVVRNRVDYTRNFTPETQLKLQAFIPPAPGCKWERPTANLGPSKVSEQHFCLYFLSFFRETFAMFAFWRRKICCTNAVINCYKICS